ncbi:MAG: hypothetical protein M3Y45_05045 [Actinomycetota bacterium]|nr:hypothetical protein [Actinomycetota bacterium]
MSDQVSSDEEPRRDPGESTDRESRRADRPEPGHRPEERIPQLDRSKVRLVNFGMSFVYWSAAVVCLLVAIAILTNLGSGEKSDSEYLAAAGGAVVFGLLLCWTGFRTYRNVSDRNPPNRD